MSEPTFTITIDVNARCPQCGKYGATVRKDGTFNVCLKCVTTKLTLKKER